MREIPLTQGYSARVCVRAYRKASPHKWCAFKTPRGTVYAARRDGKRLILMHRFLVDALPGEQVDHENGCGLDNWMTNLRRCSHTQNSQGFRRKRTGVHSRFRGVSWDRRESKWQANITVDKTQINLGRFASEEIAAETYNEAAKRFFGKFAHPNKIA